MDADWPVGGSRDWPPGGKRGDCCLVFSPFFVNELGCVCNEGCRVGRSVSLCRRLFAGSKKSESHRGDLGQVTPHPLRSTRWDLLWGVRTCRPFVKAVRDGGHVIVCRAGVVGLETGRRIIGIVRNVDGRLGGGMSGD